MLCVGSKVAEFPLSLTSFCTIFPTANQETDKNHLVALTANKMSTESQTRSFSEAKSIEQQGFAHFHKFLSRSVPIQKGTFPTSVPDFKKRRLQTDQRHAGVSDPGVGVARNGGSRCRINTDAEFSCVLRVCVERVRVHVACTMFLESVQSRWPRRPRWLRHRPRWPASHRGFNDSIYYGRERPKLLRSTR